MAAQVGTAIAPEGEPPVAGSGAHVRPTWWTRHGADTTVASALAVVATYRVVLLGVRHEPNGVDFGNWLMLGHALLGSPLPDAAHVVYPPLVPLLSVGATELFGVVWGSALVLGASGAAPGIGLYAAARMNRVRWPAVLPAVLLAATGSTGEAVAWGGAPQVIGLGCAVATVGAAARLAAHRSVAHAVWTSVCLFATAATSHLVFAQTVLVLVLLVPVTLLRAGPDVRPRFGRGDWAGRHGWLVCGAIVAAPLALLVPLYRTLLATVGETFASASSGPSENGGAVRSFAAGLEVVYRDAPWFWQPVIVCTALAPFVLAATRVRRHALWAPSVALVLAGVVQAVTSGEDRLVYFVPVVAAFVLVLLADTAMRHPLRRRARRPRVVVAGAIGCAMVVAAVAGLGYFPAERDFYARLTPPGTAEGLDWIRRSTPSDAVLLVAPVHGAPFGWWVQGHARRSAYVASEDRWLNFPEERRRAREAVSILSTDDLFDPTVTRRLTRLGIDHLVLPRAWGGVTDDQLLALTKTNPGALAHDGTAIVVVDVAELPTVPSGVPPSTDAESDDDR